MMRRSLLKRSAPLKRTTSLKQSATPMKRAPMSRRSKKPSRTKATKQHMSAVADLSCVVCRNEGLGKTPAELHHPRFLAGGGQKSSDMDVIPLCPNHHRLGGYGVAYHAGPQEWERRYGTEEELLEQTRREVAAIKEKK